MAWGGPGMEARPTLLELEASYQEADPLTACIAGTVDAIVSEPADRARQVIDGRRLGRIAGARSTQRHAIEDIEKLGADVERHFFAKLEGTSDVHVLAHLMGSAIVVVIARAGADLPGAHVLPRCRVE